MARDLSEALRLGWQYTYIYYWRAVAERNLSRNDAAIADLTTIIERNPGLRRTLSDAYAARACCYRAKGDEASAKRDLEEARRLGADGGVGKGRSRARGP